MPDNLSEMRNSFSRLTREKTVLVNGRRWGVIEAGNDGPALLMLPGTLGRANIFWQQIDALKDRARIISVSYPANHDIPTWAEDLMRLLDMMRIDRPAVMGSSLGGYLAQYIASQYPDRVDRLIAANTLSSVDGLVTQQPYASDLAGIPIQILRAGFLNGLKEREDKRPFERALYPLLYSEVNGGIPARHLRARLLALKHAPKIPPIQLETRRIVVIESDDDPLIFPALRSGVRAFLAPSTVFRFKTGGHFPYVMQPDAYLSILEEQLQLSQTGADWGDGGERVL